MASFRGKVLNYGGADACKVSMGGLEAGWEGGPREAPVTTASFPSRGRDEEEDVRFVEEVRWTSGRDIVGERLIVNYDCPDEEPMRG